MNKNFSKILDFYYYFYGLICGDSPSRYNILHCRWLSLRAINKDLKRLLPKLSGKILDVGCDGKPYEAWIDNAEECVGIDIVSGPKVDYTIIPSNSWPFPDSYFNAAICTQVLEHVKDFDNVMNEIHRVLKAGGLLVVSLPFLYNEHGAPNDYRRFSADGLRQLFEENFRIIELKKKGGIGSTLGLLFLNFLRLYTPTRIIMGALLPIWILLCFVVNVCGLIVDNLDASQLFYSSVIMLAEKK